MIRITNWSRSLAAVLLSAAVLTGAALGMGSKSGAPLINIQGQQAMLSPAMIGVGAVFMKIENSGSGDDTLVGARASIPGTVVELHDVKDGRMVKREKIEIPAKSTVELKPRSLHIMIFKMPKDIKEGQEFTLHLSFEKSGEVAAPMKFMKASEVMQHSHH